MTWLAGKKVYLTSLALFITGGAAACGWITKDQSEHIYAMLTALIAMAFRSAIASESAKNVAATDELIDTVGGNRS